VSIEAPSLGEGGQTLIVGQRATFTAKVEPAPPSATYAWTLPGSKVKGYTMSVDSAVVTELTAADLTGSSVSCFFIDAVNGQDVQLTVTIGGKSKSVSLPVTVLRPTASLSLTPTPRGVTHDASRDDIHFGRPEREHTNQEPGMLIQVSIDAGPKGAFGQMGIVQLMEPYRRYVSEFNLNKCLEQNDQLVLDRNSEATDPIYHGPAIQLDASGKAVLVVSDSPTQPSGGKLSIFIHDRFQDFVLFRPSGPSQDTIWVTLRKGRWFWKASLLRESVTEPWPPQPWPFPSVREWSVAPLVGSSIQLPVWTERIAPNEFLNCNE